MERGLRDNQRDGGADVFLRLDAHRMPDAFTHLAYQIQAHPRRSGVASAVLAGEERIKDAAQVGLRDPNAFINEINRCCLFILVDNDLEGMRLLVLLGTVLQGIANDLVQQEGQPLSIRLNPHVDQFTQYLRKNGSPDPFGLVGINYFPNQG